jgi:PleD family two-component response regulator
MRFELYFPAVETPPLAAPATKSSGAAEEPGGGATVLIADDEVALPRAVVQILRTTGYRVLEAQSSTEALEMAQSSTPEASTPC